VESLSPVCDEVRALGHLQKGVTIGRPDEILRVVEELGVLEVCNIYGSTEVYGNCCVTPHDADLNTRLTSQGPPLEGVEIRVVDETGSPVGVDMAGELQVRGRVMSGYLGQPQGDLADVFTDDGWFRTGDQASIDERGYMHFGARTNDMIKTAGINVSPAEVEAFLSKHPCVAEVLVVGAPHPKRDQVVVAFVTTIAEVSPEELRQFCKEGIADYKVPWEVVILAELPRTDTGKLTRKALIDIAAQRVNDSLS
jgi:fatty-acyl-CoA synthase